MKNPNYEQPKVARSTGGELSGGKEGDKVPEDDAGSVTGVRRWTGDRASGGGEKGLPGQGTWSGGVRGRRTGGIGAYPQNL